MGTLVPAEPTTDVENAVNRVLSAERAAMVTVEGCREQAHRVLDGARRESRRVLDRAEDRSTRVHALADRALAARLAEIRTQADQISERPLVEDDDLARVAAVVPLLVAELAGQGE